MLGRARMRKKLPVADHPAGDKARAAKRPATEKLGRSSSASMPPLGRREEILAEALRFFAEHGFGGSTIQLAKRLGVTQPLLYKYFKSKDNLIKQCLENAYPLELHHQRWCALLSSRELSIRDRLVEFYCDYSDLILSRDFLRLSLWSELAHIVPKFQSLVFDSIFRLILSELRHAHGLPEIKSPTSAQLEIVYTLHGSIHHLNVRRWIGHAKSLAGDIHPHIAFKVDVFLTGAVELQKLDGSAAHRRKSAMKARRV